jgi:hypothetical protein
MRFLPLSLLLLTLAGCSSEPEQTASKPDVEAMTGKQMAMDQAVPDFCLRDLTREGALVSLAEHRGRAVVLFFLSPN